MTLYLKQIAYKKLKVTFAICMLFLSTLQTKVIAQETLTASDCNQEEIHLAIEKLKKEDLEAFDFLVQCNTQAISALIAAIQDSNETVRIASLAILGEIGAEAKEAVPALIFALGDGDSDIRANAAYALGQIGEDAKEAVSALILVLGDEERSIRYSAAYALGRIGVEAREAVPALISALNDEAVRDYASSALGLIGKDAVPALMLALDDEDSNVRYFAASALGDIGEEAGDSIPALRAIAIDAKECFDVRDNALQSIIMINPQYGYILEGEIGNISESLQCP